MLCGFTQSFIAERHGANFACQAHLAKGHHILRQGAVIETGHRGEQSRQVGRCFTDPDTTHHIDEHVMCRQQYAAMAV